MTTWHDCRKVVSSRLIQSWYNIVTPVWLRTSCVLLQLCDNVFNRLVSVLLRSATLQQVWYIFVKLVKSCQQLSSSKLVDNLGWGQAVRRQVVGGLWTDLRDFYVCIALGLIRAELFPWETDAWLSDRVIVECRLQLIRQIFSEGAKSFRKQSLPSYAQLSSIYIIIFRWACSYVDI